MSRTRAQRSTASCRENSVRERRRNRIRVSGLAFGNVRLLALAALVCHGRSNAYAFVAGLQHRCDRWGKALLAARSFPGNALQLANSLQVGVEVGASRCGRPCHWRGRRITDCFDCACGISRAGHAGKGPHPVPGPLTVYQWPVKWVKILAQFLRASRQIQRKLQGGWRP